MEDCIFCKIVNKEIEAKIVYESDKVLAFLDVFPESLGHTLIIPKKHFINIYDIEDDYLEEVNRVAKKLALRYREILGINDVQLMHNAGKFAQQEVFHFHLHLVPRSEGDGMKLSYNQEKKVELREKFDELIGKLKA